MSLEIFNFEQGTPEWFAARCGVVTASVAGQFVSSRQPTAIESDCPECGASAASPCIGKRSPEPIKTLHPARASAARDMPRRITADIDGDVARGLVTLLVSERITGLVEETPTSQAMLRGQLDEPYARDAYGEHHAPVDQVGFMVRSDWGYRIGYSPDGLVGDDGLIEIKSRAPKKHVATILADEVPAENMAQCQAGLLVSGREWLDYVSFCGGLPLWTKRVFPDERWQFAIIEAVQIFEENAASMIGRYESAVKGLPLTERIDHFAEMEIF